VELVSGHSSSQGLVFGLGLLVSSILCLWWSDMSCECLGILKNDGLAAQFP